MGDRFSDIPRTAVRRVANLADRYALEGREGHCPSRPSSDCRNARVSDLMRRREGTAAALSPIPYHLSPTALTQRFATPCCTRVVDRTNATASFARAYV